MSALLTVSGPAGLRLKRRQARGGQQQGLLAARPGDSLPSVTELLACEPDVLSCGVPVPQTGREVCVPPSPGCREAAWGRRGSVRGSPSRHLLAAASVSPQSSWPRGSHERPRKRPPSRARAWHARTPLPESPWPAGRAPGARRHCGHTAPEMGAWGPGHGLRLSVISFTHPQPPTRGGGGQGQAEVKPWRGPFMDLEGTV